tara:strand:- start:265 stop:1521 length:1257 start_codon:yes stop_codon:yes gene_type:complete
MKKPNNDILKDYIKSFADYAERLGITGSDVGNAGRAKLDDWVAKLGGNPEHLISDYRNGEWGKELVQPVEAKPVEPVQPIEPAKIEDHVAINPFPTDADKLGQAMIDAMGVVGGRDEKLREDVTKIAEIMSQQEDVLLSFSDNFDKVWKELRQGKVANLHIKIGDKPVIDAGKVHKRFGDLLAVATCRCHAFLTGGAGSFKTSSAEKVAEVLELECSSISISSQTTETKLLGYMNAEGRYVTTEFRKRYETGGVFILDEVDNGNPNTLAVLNSALANGNCAFADGMVTKHEDFILIATANTFGSGANAQYVGRNALDQATLDRFCFIEWDYDNDLEYHIASNGAWCRDVQAIRKAVDQLKLKAVVSPRATFEGAKLLEAGMSYEDVLFAKVWKGLAKDAVDKVLEKVASNGHTLSNLK